jgi:molybdenum cofactor biosynthesis protein B
VSRLVDLPAHSAGRTRQATAEQLAVASPDAGPSVRTLERFERLERPERLKILAPMSVSTHRASAPANVRVFVLTVSDTRTLETETSGRAIAELLEAAGHQVIGRALVRDEPVEVASTLRGEIDRGTADVLITTGGTGISARDSTPDAVAALFDKPLDGFGELFRALSFQEIGAAAMLSRATAGIVRGRAVFLLPGSEAAVRLAMTRLILPELGHVVGELRKHS